MLHACAKKTRAASSEEPIRTQESHATYHSTHRKQQKDMELIKLDAGPKFFNKEATSLWPLVSW